MTGVASLNAPLIGRPDSLRQLETPALVLDRKVFEANLAHLGGLLTPTRVGLRPHAKTHKCAAIARRQLELGAYGIACAKPGELLALFAAGIVPLLLTAPVASPRKIATLAAAAAAGCDLMVVVDRPDLIAAYADAATAAKTSIGVLVDCDIGLGRSGVTTPEGAVALAKAVAAQPSLRYLGVQAYAGQVQHVHGLDARRDTNALAHGRLRPMLDGLAAAGLPAAIVSGGGTGSAGIDIEAGLFTEIQAGSYVFMDEGYRPVDGIGFAFSLFVAVTVVGHGANGEAITDGGTKSFAIDGPQPRVFLDGVEIGTIAWAGDEFGRLKTALGHAAPPAGTRLLCTAPHCDPTVNLHDVMHVVEDDRLVAMWPVEARGRSD